MTKLEEQVYEIYEQRQSKLTLRLENILLKYLPLLKDSDISYELKVKNNLFNRHQVIFSKDKKAAAMEIQEVAVKSEEELQRAFHYNDFVIYRFWLLEKDEDTESKPGSFCRMYPSKLFSFNENNFRYDVFLIWLKENLIDES